MSDYENHIISKLFETVDQVGAHLVASTYQNLVSHYSAVFYTLTAVYLGFCFLKMKRGHYSFNEFPLIILRTVIVLTLALNYGYFCSFIYDVFTQEPLRICEVITMKHGHLSNMTVNQALDQFLILGQQEAVKLFNMGSWNNITYFVFGAFVFLLVLLTAGIAAAVIVMSKCAATILFALSPLFIFSALYDATKGLFDAYIRQLLTYALMPIITAAILMIVLSVSDIALQLMQQQTQPTFIGLLPLCLICVVQLYLLLHVKSQSTGLASGFSLPTILSTFRQSKSDLASIASLGSPIDYFNKKTSARHTIKR